MKLFRIGIAFCVFAISSAALAGIGLPWPGPGAAGSNGPTPPTIIALGANGGVGNQALTGITVSNARILVFTNLATSGGPPTNSVTDTAGNTYTSIVAANPTGILAYQVFEATAVTLSGGTITCHAQNSAWGFACGAVAVTGSSGRDTAFTPATATGSGTSPAVTSNVAVAANEAVIGVVFGDQCGTFTQGSGYANDNSKACDGTSFTLLGSGHKTNFGTAAQTFNPIFGTSQNWAATIYAYKP